MTICQLKCALTSHFHAAQTNLRGFDLPVLLAESGDFLRQIIDRAAIRIKWFVHDIGPPATRSPRTDADEIMASHFARLCSVVLQRETVVAMQKQKHPDRFVFRWHENIRLLSGYLLR